MDVKRLFFSLLITNLVLFAAGGSTDAIRQVLETLSSPRAATVRAIYQTIHFTPLWSKGNGARNLNRLIGLLDDPVYNYLHRDFGQKQLARLAYDVDSGQATAQERAHLDVAATDALVGLLHFIRVGETDWNLVRQKLERFRKRKGIAATWELTPHTLPSARTIVRAVREGAIDRFIRSQVPLERRWRDLVAILDKYRKMPDFPHLSRGRSLRFGSSDERIGQIKRMLRFFGDYPRRIAIDNYFDRALADAVRSFRRRFKLPPGDFIDNKMIYYLNTPRKEYLKKILVNLEKLKLYPHRFEDEYIEVNVPEYRMRYYRNHRPIFESDVVVGRIDRPTPIFSSKMTYMVLNPTWTIPDNLVRKDLIPMLKKEPDYLETHDIHVFSGKKEVPLDREKLFSYEHDKRPIPYRFVQYPSARNALGRVKFMFPNKYSVYLHDTDNKKLFGYRYRVFSSGCMRLERPIDFMHLLLRVAVKGYDEATVDRILASNKPTTIRLNHAIPVHVVYFTVRREKGKDLFLYDIYLYDKMIWESMRGHKKSNFTAPENRLNPLHKPKKKKKLFPF